MISTNSTRNLLIQKKLILVISIMVMVLGLLVELYLRFYSVTSYPFSTYWSEAGRIFNGYQIYAPMLSGERFSWPWLDPARSLLDGLILLMPNSQIWMWRFWIALLYIITTTLTAYLIVNRSFSNIKREGYVPSRNREFPYIRWLLTGWAILFLFQSPIYYHLLISVIPILVFYQRKRPAVTALLVVIMGVWSGLTRINWFVMPAVVAIILYLLEQSKGSQSYFQYLKWPGIWITVNIIASGITYLVSLDAAGQPSILSAEMSYGYFLSKLWSNQGNPLGLIPGILLISLPLLIILLYSFWQYRDRLNRVRTGLLAFILIVLSAGSTLVSLRAGGGYDFHNYDTLLVALLIIVVHFGLGDVAFDQKAPVQRRLLLDSRVILLLFVLPIIFLVRSIQPKMEYPNAASDEAIQHLNAFISTVRAKSEQPILFIDHRQLVIYDYIQQLPLYQDYENIELMEMAMAKNEAYFRQFREDIENKKFPLIVSSNLLYVIREPSEDPFWYENNVWSDYVAWVILQNYDPIYTNRDVDLAVYVPKE